MVNRLSGSVSPYLQQHADNPVDWYEWGDDAFAAARERDVPILLSVGYAACHWCHVMAHDSFERDDVAAVMNAGFVNVKVDREERPDVDAVYMDATVALTGQGGWPMTCLLTPDGKPFYAGTFFPRDQFVRLLEAAGEAWRAKRSEVVDAGQRIADAMATAGVPGLKGDAPAPGAADLGEAAAGLVKQFDADNGGFGQAPKFPPSMVLEFLLRHHERTGDPAALAMTEQTLDAMARGGIYDQLAGGFARYSVDAQWVVPHFEKMLYDNAQLLRVYLHWWRLRGDALGERVARETADFLLRDLGTPEGGFASALDADTDGVEGLTYVWTPAQLADALGADADAATELFTVTPAGTFEHGTSTLQLPRDPEDFRWYEAIREKLGQVRAARPQPGRDDKVVAAWNGLVIAALAEAGVLLDRRYLDAALACAQLILDVHVVDGRLRRTSRDGVVGDALAVAEDYGDVAEGFLALHQATGDARWLDETARLLDVAVARFRADDGGFFDTGDDAETLVRRPRDVTDNAAPSGSSALAAALLTYSALAGSPVHRTFAEQVLGVVATPAVQQPRFFGWVLASAEALVDGPLQVALVGGDQDLETAAWTARPGGAVVVAGDPDAPGIPLLAGRTLVGGRAAAYVCRGMVCDLPVTTVADLTGQLTVKR
ncbi:MAG TPA: thioredoxin domain-containing protein [Jatrophihabitans sp.]